LQTRLITTTWLAALLCLLSQVAGNASHADGRGFPQGSGGINASHQMDKPYVVLVSIDGFRWDYPDIYTTPALDRIAGDGVRAERMIPVFPTLTFPNHYSIATGMYPARHGLVANAFPDRGMGSWYALGDRAAVEDGRYYNGEPAWVTAETQGMVSAAFFFVGTEAAIRGVYPTHWKSYDKGIPGSERVDQVLAWLGEPPETRPHLYMLYFEDVDDNSHWHGPASKQSIEAIRRVDGYLARLLDGIAALPHGDRVHLVVVSDHGQGTYRQDVPPLVLAQLIDLKGIKVVEGGSYAYLHFDAPDAARAESITAAINADWPHGRAWLPSQAPDSWAITPNGRYPDVIVQPDPGYGVISVPENLRKLTAGDHGWAPEAEDMHGIFLACGPRIRAGANPGPVRAVDVYPLILDILDLEKPANIDGDAKALRHILVAD
jgi:predicted AlkP superfamily pyrophosphatase or phosphodiesterase